MEGWLQGYKEIPGSNSHKKYCVHKAKCHLKESNDHIDLLLFYSRYLNTSPKTKQVSKTHQTLFYLKSHFDRSIY